MTSLYKILKSAKLGAGAAQDFHTAIMAQKMPFAKRSGAEHEYTGAVPVTFTANGQPLLDYLISGNTVQSGTPSPDNPIMPQGCGELETSGEHSGQYKIPVSSANTTTPVYLGEVQTTRKIRKLVLTGNEGWQRTANEKCYYINFANGCPADYLKSNIVTVMCSHYKGQRNTSSGSNEVNEGCICFFTGGGFELYIGERTITTAENLKAFLAAQYAAGTPVTVWYVLASETTAVVNEPLMKIGDYADTLSHAQAGVSIPTANGSTTLDVETAVKPSEIYIKYKS